MFPAHIWIGGKDGSGSWRNGDRQPQEWNGWSSKTGLSVYILLVDPISILRVCQKVDVPAQNQVLWRFSFLWSLECAGFGLALIRPEYF